MHNNTNYHRWNKALTFGVGSIQSVFVPLCSPNTCKDVFNSNVFNPNVTAFQSNCAESLHFSAFHLELQLYVYIIQNVNMVIFDSALN